MAWQEGKLIKEGKYEIKQKLGQGGYGTVYLAIDRSGRDVAIKTLHDHLREHEDYERFEQDFMNEARRLAEFSHLPFIVSIYEVIKEEDTWGIVMEYIDGKNLDHFGIISEELALLYIQQISSALSNVHEKGLLHRDIKPSNILVRNETSEAILVDFGIAREFTSKIIQTQTPLWTPYYASPEQYNERIERSASSDIYSLAATLYKILTGKEPESAPSRMCGCVLKEPKQINPSISDAVQLGIINGLELQASNRPQSIEEWLRIMDLRLILPSEYGISQNNIDSKNTEELLIQIQRKNWIEHRVEFFIMELSSSVKYIRDVAIRELGNMRQYASSAVPHLIQMMESTDDDIFSREVEHALVMVGSASVIPLALLLQNEKVEIRRKSAKALARIGEDSSSAASQIVSASADSDNEVIWYIIIAIGNSGTIAKDAIPFLIKKLSSVEACIRAYASWALGKMGEYAQSAIPELIKMVYDEKNKLVKLAVLESLEVLGYDIGTIYFEYKNVKRRNAKQYIKILRGKRNYDSIRPPLYTYGSLSSITPPQKNNV